MNEMMEKLKSLLADRRILVVAGGGLFFVLLIVFSSNNNKEKVNKDVRVSSEPLAGVIKAQLPVKAPSGLFLGEDVDRKAFVGRLEEQYRGTQEKTHQLEAQIEQIDKRVSELLRSQGAVNESLLNLETKLSEATQRPGNQISGGSSIEGADANNYRLELVNINPVAAAEPEGVFLPAGSFVRGTLLTGVYAPADQNNPLPVLIRLNEAFYGPNEERVPLEGAFVIGKAVGELNSERAMIQGSILSAILPNGKEFQHEGNIGYITDMKGDLGIRGVVVRNTGGQMAAAFMSGFLGGSSQAVAEGETTAVRSSSGTVSRNVTGDIGKYAAFQGLSQSAAQLSKYYADQLNAIVPAVKVDAGVDVYLIILEGVRINGLKINKPDDARYLD